MRDSEVGSLDRCWQVLVPRTANNLTPADQTCRTTDAQGWGAGPSAIPSSEGLPLPAEEGGHPGRPAVTSGGGDARLIDDAAGTGKRDILLRATLNAGG